MKKKIQKIIDTLDIPADVNKGFYLEMFSEKEAVLTGDITVTELGDSVLMLRCGEHGINIYGKKLWIISYTADGIRVGGKIEKIEFL